MGERERLRFAKASPSREREREISGKRVSAICHAVRARAHFELCFFRKKRPVSFGK